MIIFVKLSQSCFSIGVLTLSTSLKTSEAQVFNHPVSPLTWRQIASERKTPPTNERERQKKLRPFDEIVSQKNGWASFGATLRASLWAALWETFRQLFGKLFWATLWAAHRETLGQLSASKKTLTNTENSKLWSDQEEASPTPPIQRILFKFIFDFELKRNKKKGNPCFRGSWSGTGVLKFSGSVNYRSLQLANMYCHFYSKFF